MHTASKGFNVGDFFLVNAFTGEKARGNQTAIVLVDDLADEGFLLHISQDINLPATTFLQKKQKGEYAVRWFAPGQEIPLCGHGTIGASWLLLHHLKNAQQVLFHFKGGTIKAVIDGQGVSVEFDALRTEETTPSQVVVDGFGRKPEAYFASQEKHFLVFDDPEFVRTLKPDFDTLRKSDVFGYVVTAPGTDTDIVTRVFIPFVPFLEDQATGSAHVLLAPYWSGHLGKTSFTSRQVSQRGGAMRCRYNKDSGTVTLTALAEMFGYGTLIDNRTPQTLEP